MSLSNDIFLLPCPFCGWEKPSVSIEEKQLTICVKCTCGANSKVVPLNLKDSTKIAIDFWNMRSNPFLVSKISDKDD